MKLIADGGSTKTEWCLCNEGKLVKRVFTGGMNPYILDNSEILELLRTALLPQLDGAVVTEIHYYGAGCRDAVIPNVKSLFASVFAHAAGMINVYSDMVAAARALFGSEPGIACIMGTGSNSCYYDGVKIADAVPPLGYVLGDEGSGSDIGKTLVNAILKRRMPKEIADKFYEQTGLTADEVIRRTYRETEPGRFLASLTHFAADNMEHAEIRNLIRDCFGKFFRNNIAPYGRKNCKIAAMGSVAYYFNETLKEAAQQEGYTLCKIIKSPMEGLLEYHGVKE